MTHKLTKHQVLFDLPSGIRGNQLAHEIASATGLDAAQLRGDISLEPDGRASLPREGYEEFAETIAPIVASHAPDPLYFEEDVKRAERKANEADDLAAVKARAAADPAYAALARRLGVSIE